MPETKRKLIVIGAGAAGRKTVEQIKKEGRRDIVVVGFVDDDTRKQGQNILGVPVVGTTRDLPKLVRKHRVDQVLISTPSMGGDFMQRVAQLLPTGFSIKVLPSVSSVILGKVDLSYVRDIDPSDLIGRPLVKANQQFIAKSSTGKTFLVTGGAGSIGSEIVRQLYDSKAKRIVIVDSWEEGIFNMTEELAGRKRAGAPEICALIANVRDKKRMDEVVGLYKVDVILHAAAYKHVPLMEENPSESHKTNYVGTKNMLDLAIKYKVRDFVLISTDKAVNPVSVMGKSKRAAELLVQKYARTHKHQRFCAVRFGNVINSSGSIIPKFLKQIRSRSAVTITDMRMTRYFMSIPEAVSLVLLSWIVGKNGQILILDMGEPVKIIDLATQLIKMHGLEPYKDIPIVEIGARPGEKIHEELAYDKTRLRQSPAERVFIAEEM